MKKLLLPIYLIFILSLTSCADMPLFEEDGSFSDFWLWIIIFVVFFLALWEGLSKFGR